MSEVWKPIPGYNNWYQVSDKGRVKSTARKHEHIKATTTCGAGYQAVVLHNKGVEKLQYVHRLVAEAFIPNQNNFPEVNHKDENKSNNSADNLEWCTAKYNRNYGTRRNRISETLKKNAGRRRNNAKRF